MRRSAIKYKPIVLPEDLVNQFLHEVLTAIAAYEHYSDAADALREYFERLRRYRWRGDFQGQGVLPRPQPLQLLIDPYALYGFFCAWLRKRGIDPEVVAEYCAS
jgi:hypothetical protein